MRRRDMRYRPRRGIPGIGAPAGTDLPVLKPVQARGAGAADDLVFSRFVASVPSWAILGLVGLAAAWPAMAVAQSQFTVGDALHALWVRVPHLVLDGFLFNVLISFLTMLIGTVFGVLLGLGQISIFRPLRGVSWFVTQTFRNSPWLVLLFIVILAFPFEITLFGLTVPLPDWIKAVFGLSLPIMTNISEIVRGAVMSVPTGQWEASDSLAFSRTQTLWRIILPQCVKRMIPPWMNWYAILTMATPLVSILGVQDLVRLTQDAMSSAGSHPELLIPFYGFALLLFFVYCYPIARLTIALERRVAVKL